jgi:hypothetical protein
MCRAKAAESMEPALFQSKFCQQRVQLTTENVRVAQRLTGARTEHQTALALADVLTEKRTNRWMKVNQTVAFLVFKKS